MVNLYTEIMPGVYYYPPYNQTALEKKVSEQQYKEFEAKLSEAIKEYEGRMNNEWLLQNDFKGTI